MTTDLRALLQESFVLLAWAEAEAPNSSGVIDLRNRIAAALAEPAPEPRYTAKEMAENFKAGMNTASLEASSNVARMKEALREIALAGMTTPLDYTDRETQHFHATQAFRFIKIAAWALDPSAAAAAKWRKDCDPGKAAIEREGGA